MDEICTTLGPGSIVSNQIQVCPQSVRSLSSPAAAVTRYVFDDELVVSFSTSYVSFLFLLPYVVWIAFFLYTFMLMVLRHPVLTH